VNYHLINEALIFFIKKINSTKIIKDTIIIIKWSQIALEVVA
jgi:hypothetical protein